MSLIDDRTKLRHDSRVVELHPSAERATLGGRREERFDTTVAVKLDAGAGSARNVSASGIYFITDVRLRKGDAVALTFEFDQYPGGGLQMKCAARVVRVEEQSDGMLGIAVAISGSELHRLRKHA